MDIKTKMNGKFRDLQGGLFLKVTKADVGEGAGILMEKGYRIMAWADMFFPDPSLPASVKRAMVDSIEGGVPAHYVMPIGAYDLRKAIAAKVGRTTGLKLDPSRNVIVTPGSDSGLLYALMPFLNEGDEVLIPDPSYPSNFLDPKLLGGVAVHVPLHEEDGYQIRIDEFERRVTPRTRVVLVTHPNNPTTTVWNRASVEELAAFVIRHDLVLVSDQAFEDHVYDGREFISPATLPGMWERTVTVCSISKGYGLSGLRIGYIYADDRIMDVLYGGAVNVLGAASTVSSVGAVAALGDETLLPSHFVRLERRRRIAYEILSTIPGVTMTMPESGILAWLNVSRLGTAAEVAAQILEEAHIMVNEGTPYGREGEGHIRIVIACFNDDLDAIAAFEGIKSALTKLAKKKGVI
ncbi:MAG: pyridoxal phosphate-dependent aminotransferase [Candidatus Izemoplasmatales bacterium]